MPANETTNEIKWKQSRNWKAKVNHLYNVITFNKKVNKDFFLMQGKNDKRNIFIDFNDICLFFIDIIRKSSAKT